MKFSTLIVSSLLLYSLSIVDGSSLRDKKVKGDNHDPHRQLAIQQRKQVPYNHVMKSTLKLARQSRYFFFDRDDGTGQISSTSIPSPTQKPTQSPTNAPTKRPTRSPTKQPTPFPTRPPTQKPTPVPPSSSLTIIGDDDNPGYKFPLGMCQGDCDGDSECAGNLLCMHRDGFEKVPGCGGNGAVGIDYCFDPSLSKAPTMKPTSQELGNSDYSFMLRLYWSIDYFWQETKNEAWWCLECTKCDEYSMGDGPNHGCVVPGSTGSSCAPGH